MSKICTNCGSPVNDETGFCPNCGTSLKAPEPTPQAAQTVEPAPQAPQAAEPTPQVPQVSEPVRQSKQPAVQPAADTTVKQKRKKAPLIASIVAVLIVAALVVVIVINPFRKEEEKPVRKRLDKKLENSFSDLCDMTKLGSQSYAYARLLTEQLLETDLASADPAVIDELFKECLDAWKASEEVSGKMISMSDTLASEEGIKNANLNNSNVSVVYAEPGIVDLLFPFTVRASAADDDIVTEVSEVASPDESLIQCSTFAMQILSDSQRGYTAVTKLKSIYSGRTTPVQEWNNVVSTMAVNFGMQFYVSGEITSGEFTTLPNGAHSVHTLSNTIKPGTIGVSNTDILIDIGENGGCMVFGTTSGLTINQEQFPDYTPSEGNRTISINTYPEGPNENGVTFHATSFFSWFRIDRVGGFRITRGDKDGSSVVDPPTVENTGDGTSYTPPESTRGPITDFIPPISPEEIRETSEEITNPADEGATQTNPTENSPQTPLTGNDITHIAGDLGAGVGPITVTLGWQTDDDLDIHVITPNESRIYYRNKTAQGGTLDVDMNARESEINIPAIENIYFPDPENGHYKVYLRNFRDRTGGTATHWVIKVKVGDAENIFEGDIDASGTEQFVFEFDYGAHGTESTLPPPPDGSTMGGTLIERGAKTGKITVSTMWNRFDDVDLHIEAPQGAHIYYSNKTAGGGQLDVDANAGSQRILDPVENIFFEHPRNGHYKVYLNQFSDRSDDSASYLVRINVDGEVREFTGTIDGTGTNITIYEFDYNGSEETPGGSFNGHRYEYYPNADISWTEARAMCQSMGGHLVTITSADEQAFIESTFPGTTGWIGGYGDNNGWSWVTGETFGGYTYWKSGEPNDQGGIEWCGHLWSDMTWNDLDNEDKGNYQTGFYCEFDEYGDATGYRGSSNNGNTVTTTPAVTPTPDIDIEPTGTDDGGNGYWKLTKVTSYVKDITEDGVNTAYIEGSSSRIITEGMGETTDRSITETESGLQFRYYDKYSYTSYGEIRSGSSTAITTSTLPKTAYAAKETAVLSFTNKASDTGEGSVGSNICADFWHGPHTVSDSYFVNGSDFVDDSGEDDLNAYSPNYWTSEYPPEGTHTVKGDFPDEPNDLSDEKDTIINIRISSNSMLVCYTYEWTGGAMPANVGAASGYISNDAPVTDSMVSGTYNGHTYTVIERELDPLAADDYCKSMGGYLASITSQGEQDFVAGLAAQVDYEDFWIGGSDYGSEGTWYWLTGEPWSFTTWYPGGPAGEAEPNNGIGAGEDYVFMNRTRGYRWVDGYGGYSRQQLYFICESGELDISDGPTDGIQDERTRQGAGNGEITISLMWDSEDDLDMHIFTPDGSELWWGNPNAEGGTFDIDANREGNIKENPLENAYFATPTSGEYWIYVYNYEDRTPGSSTNWTVRIQVGDEEQIYSGTITSQEETIEVLGFNYTSGTGRRSSSGGSSGNLLTNSDASNGMNGWSAPDGYWTTDSSYDSVEAYDSYYFCTKGYTGTEPSRMFQDVNISDHVGKKATLSAMNRAYRSGHPDESMLQIEFLDSSGNVINSAESNRDSGNSDWHSMSVTATVPSGAVKARVSLYTFYKTGSESDSYYDNISLTVA